MSKRNSIEISYIDEDENLHCRYNDASEIIAELEAELARKIMALADTEALLMGTEERLKKLEVELAELKNKYQILFPVAQSMAERCREIDPQCNGEFPPCWRSYVDLYETKAKED